LRACLLALLLATPVVVNADAARDEAAVMAALHAACDAYAKGDAAYLEQALEDRFTLTDTRGAITTKADELAAVRAREPKYEIFRNSEMKVRLYGDAALVTGITEVKGASAGKPFHSRLQFTDTLVRRAGRWLIAASHVSPAPTEASSD
jgi:ketosteroid isomerase-like protein